MYLTVHEEVFLSITGVGLGKGRGMFGRNRAPLNLIMKKKQPRKTPWGDEPGKDLTEEVAPLYLITILVFVRYEIKIPFAVVAAVVLICH